MFVVEPLFLFSNARVFRSDFSLYSDCRGSETEPQRLQMKSCAYTPCIGERASVESIVLRPQCKSGQREERVLCLSLPFGPFGRSIKASLVGDFQVRVPGTQDAIRDASRHSQQPSQYCMRKSIKRMSEINFAFPSRLQHIFASLRFPVFPTSEHALREAHGCQQIYGELLSSFPPILLSLQRYFNACKLQLQLEVHPLRPGPLVLVRHIFVPAGHSWSVFAFDKVLNLSYFTAAALNEMHTYR